MIVSDLVRVGVFAALPFVGQPGRDRSALAGVTGIATGFFLPAAYAALPNLVPDEELTNANSLLHDRSTRSPGCSVRVVGGLMLHGLGPVGAVRRERGDVPRVRDPRLPHPGNEPPLRGVAHARALARRRRRVPRSSLTSRPLRTVLIVWNVGTARCSARSTSRRSFFAKETLDAGNLGFGAPRCGERCRPRRRKLPERARPRARSGCVATTSVRSC